VSVLKIEHVFKSYEDVHAVQDLTLELAAGTIYGLLGPNGAGKTTTIRMIMNIIMPDKGSIHILDQPISQKTLDQVGYLPEERGLYRKMKVSDQLSLLAELKGIKRLHSKEKIRKWLERFDLLDWSNKKIEELSKGMQQKVQFIATILHEPRLIILDEPFTGLDPLNTDLIKNIMLEQKTNGTTIIFSTHMMEQVEKLCDSICLIDKGKAVLQGNIKQIKKTFGKNIIRMEYEGASDFLKNNKLIKDYKLVDHLVEIEPAEGVSSQQILQQAITAVNVIRFEMMEPSLHDIFIETVTKKEGEQNRE